jgi:hypothetical protein
MDFTSKQRGNQNLTPTARIDGIFIKNSEGKKKIDGKPKVRDRS